MDESASLHSETHGRPVTSTRPPLEDGAARRIWNGYFRRVEQMLQPLGEEQKRELMLELESHLRESIRQDASGREVERVLNGIDRLGEPEQFLRPLVADRLLKEGRRTYNPLAIGKGLGLALSRGLRWAALSILFAGGYLCSFLLILMALLKPVFPRHVGYFTYASGGWGFGFLANVQGATEHLGYGMIPLALGTGLLLYAALTKGLIVLRGQAT